MAYTDLRSILMRRLSDCEEIVPGDVRFYQGRLLSETLSVPEVRWGSTAAPSSQLTTSPPWLTATEFSDSDSSLHLKVSALQDLLLSSRHTVVYAGAGTSTAAGLRQWARGRRARGRDTRTTEAVPSVTHLSLASLVKVSLSLMSSSVALPACSAAWFTRLFISTLTVSCRRLGVPRRKSLR